MKSENLIHIKLEYNEAVKAKKDILSTEMNLLRILRIIKKYRDSRTQELVLKTKIHRKIKEFLTNMKKLETLLPKVKIPEVLKEDDEEISKIKTKKKLPAEHKDIESQLQEIQNQLKNLGS